MGSGAAAQVQDYVERRNKNAALARLARLPHLRHRLPLEVEPHAADDPESRRSESVLVVVVVEHVFGLSVQL